MRRMIPIAIALLVAAPLAGCITAQATAMQYRDAAHARAQEWDSNAELAQIVGVEGQFEAAMGSGAWSGWSGSGFYGAHTDSDDPTTQSRHGDAAYWDRAKEDPRLGDGRAEFWVYTFVAEGNDEKLFVVVDRDGEVIDSGTSDREGDDDPLGTWNVDSDRALEIAKDANQGIREGTDKENFGLLMVLDDDDEYEHATWTVVGGGGDASGGGGGIVVVDAVNGTVLSSHGGFSSG